MPASAAVLAELNAIPPDPNFNGAPELYRVGMGVSPPIPVYKPEPKYTHEAAKKKISGTVLVHVVIDKSGHTRDIKVLHGLGYGLDEEAVECVSHWEFKPGMKDGNPVNVAATIEVNFRIRKDR